MIKKYKKEMGDFTIFGCRQLYELGQHFTLVDYIIHLLWMELLVLIEF